MSRVYLENESVSYSLIQTRLGKDGVVVKQGRGITELVVMKSQPSNQK